MAKTVATDDEKALAKPERFIYCGPSLPGGLLLQHTIFKGGIPEHIKPVIEKCPAVKSLLVAPAKLQGVNAAIKTQGSLENLRYKEILNFIQEGGLKDGV